MEAAAWFSPEQGRELWQDYLRRKQLPAQQTQSFPQRRPIDEPSPHRVFVCNTMEEEIPAYACMRIIGTRNINNITALDVEKPTSTEGEFIFNSQYPIAAKVPAVVDPPTPAVYSVGWGYRFGIVVMLGDDPTTVNKPYRPIVDSWEVEEGSGPFIVFGHHRAKENDDDRALIGRFYGGNTTSWGKIHEVGGCGFYTVELGTLDGAPPEFDATACNPCDGVTGAGTSGCALELTYPSSRVTGSGVYVTAYDPQSVLIPLRGGSDCVVTHAGPATESAKDIWAILNGTQEHIVQYKERWDCCAPDGPPVLVGKTPIVFVGKECDEILCESCP